MKTPKTVYDPKVFSDEQIIDYGKAAISKTYRESVEIYKLNPDKNTFYGSARGVRFTYYLTRDSNGNIYVSNFHPSR